MNQYRTQQLHKHRIQAQASFVHHQNNIYVGLIHHTQEFGNPPGGVEPSYKQRWPLSQWDKQTVVRCSAMSCSPSQPVSQTSNKQPSSFRRKCIKFHMINPMVKNGQQICCSEKACDGHTEVCWAVYYFHAILLTMHIRIVRVNISSCLLPPQFECKQIASRLLASCEVGLHRAYPQYLLRLWPLVSGAVTKIPVLFNVSHCIRSHLEAPDCKKSAFYVTTHDFILPGVSSKGQPLPEEMNRFSVSNCQVFLNFYSNPFPSHKKAYLHITFHVFWAGFHHVEPLHKDTRLELLWASQKNT